MSTLDVVAEVLREVAPRALKARQIAALAGDRLPTASRTPETVVSRDLAIDVRDHGAASRFLRVDRGAFVLKEALPTAFYNDNESYAAQWTRNLIAAGEIAAGVVDERSIRDLKPADVASFRQFHAFSGIGVWSRALRDAGWPDDVNVWSGSCPCFRVIEQDDHGAPVRCSGCPRDVRRVVVLPLTYRPELEDRFRASDGDELWMSVCAHCLLAMAKALARAEGKL